LETSLNTMLRELSIVGRSQSIIIITLDDDKIWAANSGQNASDRFGLRYTQHVKDNRKGIVAHTAVSSTTSLPIGIAFERVNESSNICFRRIMDSLFPYGNNRLRDVIIHSDRGYLTPSLVYDYLLNYGAHVVGTVKRAACWPFTFGNKINPDKDKRSDVSTNGPPALFVKSLEHSGKLLNAVAFRNGTDTVSTAISTIHANHHWDGISLNRREWERYKNDPMSLRSEALVCAIHSFVNADEKESVKADTTYLNSLLVDKGKYFSGSQLS
jgi:hypothetical protein